MKHYLFSVGLLLLATSGLQQAQAQAPAWQSAIGVASGAVATVTGTVADAAGNVYVTGYYGGTARFGTIQLSTATLASVETFVAKWNPATGYVWAVRAGGSGSDGPVARALALQGTSIYVAGDFSSQTATFGNTVLTNAWAPVSSRTDTFVAKLTDAGSSASFVGAVRAGGATEDESIRAVAVQGTSVFVTGDFRGISATFGNTTLTNTGPSGTRDVYVARLDDAGAGLTYAWAARAGGTGNDTADGLAASGSSVYLTGSVDRNASFGSIGLTRNSGYIAKLTDAGSSASFTWVQPLGGASGQASGNALAVSGTAVYITGNLGGTVAFGSSTINSVGIFDAYVARLNDAGATSSFAWALRAGGSDLDLGQALAVSGSNVYVGGSFSEVADFGSSNLTSAGRTDVFVAKVLDAGSSASFAWAQRAGGPAGESVSGLALSSNRLCVVGAMTPPASFGTFTLANTQGYLASLTDPALPTATAAGRALAPAQLFPNPAHGTATLRLPAGTAPAPLTLTDAQGRTVRHYPAPGGVEAALDLGGLPAGLYLLRGAGPVRCLAVE